MNNKVEWGGLAKCDAGHPSGAGVDRRKVKHGNTVQLNNKIRNKYKEKEKMSLLFTRDRRKEARQDFSHRMEMNKQKAKMKKKRLEMKYYDFSFKPKTNRKRIKIYNKKLPRNVYHNETPVTKRLVTSNLKQSVDVESKSCGLDSGRGILRKYLFFSFDLSSLFICFFISLFTYLFLCLFYLLISLFIILYSGV